MLPCTASGAAPARFQGDTKKKTLASLLAAATIALTLTATATDVSAQWRRRGWGWGPGVAAGVLGGAVIAGAIIASRPQGYVVYPGYAQPVYGPGCYWASQPVYDVAGRFVGYTGPDRYRSALAMLRLRRPAGLRRMLRPRQNDRVSRRIKSQRSSDKPPWENALLHRAGVASAPRLQGRNHSLISRPVMNACGSRHPAMTNAIKEIIRTM